MSAACGGRSGLGDLLAASVGGAADTGGSPSMGGMISSGGGAAIIGGAKSICEISESGGDASTDSSTGEKLVATMISAGMAHTCALLNNGTVACWGSNGDGQLGNPAVADVSTVPVIVPGVCNANAVFATGMRTCVTNYDGSVQCWGLDSLGQGQNAASVTSAPRTISSISDVRSIAADEELTCAALKAGAVMCWGSSGFGLGDGINSSAPDSSPVAVLGVSSAINVATGNMTTCAALSNGSIQCWGSNGYCEFANGTAGNSSRVPVTVAAITDAVSVAVGYFHVCALLSDGSVRCWGLYGLLGDGSATVGGAVGTTEICRASPVAVLGITNAMTLAAGTEHTCVVLTDDTVQCWGKNYDGELGIDPTTATTSTVPVLVSGLTNAASVTCGDRHSCALLRDGSVQCWGDNSGGQLGQYGSTSSSVPVTVAGF